MIEWRLKEALAEQGIQNSSQFKIALEKKMGIEMSRVALNKLLIKEPLALRIQTAQYICTLLQTPLDHFLKVSPDSLNMIAQPTGRIIQPYGYKRPAESTVIVDPRTYF